MKLYYIANIRMPTERAHGIQVMEMCKAFAGVGREVELLVPNRKTDITDDPFAFYDIDKSFDIRKLWCLDLVRFGRIGFWLESLTFTLSVTRYLKDKEGILYTRDELIALALARGGRQVVWEAHRGQTNAIIRKLLALRQKTVVITDALRDLYIKHGARSQGVLTAPDGADIDRFDLPLSKSEAREKLGLPQDKTIVLYKGSLEAWKGAGTIAEAARLTSSSELLFVFIGGKPADVEAFKTEFKDVPNLAILGNRPRKETPIYQKAADILVIPNSAKEDISKLYTSPMKLFGYMAGGVPIIASDLPSLREILNESRAYFFTPDDGQSLASTIDTLLNQREAAEEKAAMALEEVRQYSWKNRAEKILKFLNQT